MFCGEIVRRAAPPRPSPYAVGMINSRIVCEFREPIPAVVELHEQRSPVVNVVPCPLRTPLSHAPARPIVPKTCGNRAIYFRAVQEAETTPEVIVNRTSAADPPTTNEVSVGVVTHAVVLELDEAIPGGDGRTGVATVTNRIVREGAAIRKRLRALSDAGIAVRVDELSSLARAVLHGLCVVGIPHEPVREIVRELPPDLLRLRGLRDRYALIDLRRVVQGIACTERVVEHRRAVQDRFRCVSRRMV